MHHGAAQRPVRLLALKVSEQRCYKRAGSAGPDLGPAALYIPDRQAATLKSSVALHSYIAEDNPDAAGPGSHSQTRRIELSLIKGPLRNAAVSA